MKVTLKRLYEGGKNIIEAHKIISGIIGIGTILIGLFWKIYRNDYYLYLSFIFTSFLLWIVFIYFIWQKVKSTIKVDYSYYKYKNRYIYTVCSTVVIIIFISYFVAKIFILHKINSKKTIVLIIPFKNESDSTKEIFSTLLYGELNEQLDTDKSIKVELYETAISENEGGIKKATLVAKEKKASILIWGWYSKSPTNVYLKTKFEILDSTIQNVTPDLSIENENSSFKINELNNFELQTQITSNNSFLIFSCLGYLKYIQHQWGGGINYFSKALKFQSNDINMSSVSLFKGNCFYASREVDSAAFWYTKSIKYNKKYTPPYIGLGNIAGNRNQFELALEYYNAALYYDPDDLIAYNNKGVVYMKTHQYALAGQNFMQAFTIAPGDSVTLRNEAKWIEISNKYEHNVEINAKNKKSNSLYTALLQRSVYYYYSKRYEEALQDINACIKIAPDSSNLYVARGNIEDENGNNTEASLKDYSFALKLKPNNFRTYYERAVIYKRLGHVKLALQDYLKSISIHPNPEAYNNIAAIYMEWKMYKKAYDNFYNAFKISQPVDSANYKNHMDAALYYLKQK